MGVYRYFRQLRASLSEYMKIWCNIQLIINNKKKNIEICIYLPFLSTTAIDLAYIEKSESIVFFLKHPYKDCDRIVLGVPEQTQESQTSEC